MDSPNRPLSQKLRFRAIGAPPRPATQKLNPEKDAEAPVEAETQAFPETLPAESEPTDLAAMAEAEDDDSHVPPGLRLTRSADAVMVRSRHGVSFHALIWIVLGVLLVGVLAGYSFGGGFDGKRGFVGLGKEAALRAGRAPLSEAVEKQLDSAFNANKATKYDEARKQFDSLYNQHPDWASVKVEAARAALYHHDPDTVQKELAALRERSSADVEFLHGLLQMTAQQSEQAELYFASAAAVDPTRPEVYYFWGECLRRDGKPRDAALRFKQALIRNQYETSEGLYQLKLWLSEIQADMETSPNTSGVKLDDELASAHPSAAAWFAAAARAIKAGKYKEAAENVVRGRERMDPAVFRAVLQDPMFTQENFRPEFAGFYK